MDQKLCIATARGFLGLVGSDLTDNAVDPQAFLMSSTGTGPINYGDRVTLVIEGPSPVLRLRVEVDPTGSHHVSANRVPLGSPLQGQRIPGQRIPGPAVPGVPAPRPQPAKSTDTFVVAQLPGGVGAFGDGSAFALLSDYGCLRGQNGSVLAGGAVDGDVPARLGAKFQ
jgi:hypothetical protein